MSEPRRALSRMVSTVLVSGAVAVLAIPAAQSASPSHRARSVARPATTDLYRSQQWTLNALHIPHAWHYSRGNGVTVAVLDTGVDGHQPDLAGRVVDGPDFTGHARRPGDRYWGRHGTSMASIIAGHGHGPGGTAGVMGVAPEAKILSIRVTWELGDPARSDRTQVDHSRDAIAKGIRYAADHGAQVISMSLGGGKLFYEGNPVEEAAIKYALGKGIVLIASSGNDGGGGPNRRNYPAAYPGVIAVGAVDRTYQPAKFTNRHTYVSVAAPGVEIVSADVSGHGYVLGTGTSSSAAFVAGMSALIKARYPRLTPAEVKQAIEEGATHRPPEGRSSRVGTGVADAYGGLRAAAHINRAEHGGAGVNRPPATPSAPATAQNGPDVMLIAVLSGGGTLIVLSLILGWRHRRRAAAEDDEDDDELDEPGGFDAHPGDVPVARGTARPSPWEPRSDDEAFAHRQSELDPYPDDRPGALRTATDPRRESWQDHDAHPPAPPRTPADARWDDNGPGDAWEASRSSSAAEARWDATGDSWRSEEPQPAHRDTRTPASGSGDSWQSPHEAATSPTESWRIHDVPESSHDRPAEEPAWRPPEEEAPATSGMFDSYEPPAWLYESSNGHDLPPTQNFRTVEDVDEPTGEPSGQPLSDPLSDEAPIDSSADVGTPLADQSWESIRRGFDRLKQETDSWGTAPRHDDPPSAGSDDDKGI